MCTQLPTVVVSREMGMRKGKWSLTSSYNFKENWWNYNIYIINLKYFSDWIEEKPLIKSWSYFTLYDQTQSLAVIKKRKHQKLTHLLC